MSSFERGQRIVTRFLLPVAGRGSPIPRNSLAVITRGEFPNHDHMAVEARLDCDGIIYCLPVKAIKYANVLERLAWETGPK